MPGPLPGTARWDLKAINVALDRLSDIVSDPSQSSLDEWKLKRARSP
jgi:hypothetical protein